MTNNRQNFLEFLKNSGAVCCKFISAEMLIPEKRIREYCYENKCGCYDKHLTCPPFTGTIFEIKEKLKLFKKGILIQYAENINVKSDKKGIKRTRLKLHHIVLETEKYLQEKMGVKNAWGMIGGCCALCDVCAGFNGEPCEYPEKARVSMEALAIDVVSLLNRLNLDNKFRNNRISWTGAVLFDSDF